MPLNKETKPNQTNQQNFCFWYSAIKSFTRIYSQIISLWMLGKLAAIAEGDQKAPFSIATTPRCRGGYYSFP